MFPFQPNLLSIKLLSFRRLGERTWQACLATGFYLALVASVFAAPALYDTFDAPTPAWQLRTGGKFQMVQQGRVRVERQGETTGAEQVRLVGPAGYAGMLGWPIDPAPVLEDLQVRLTIRSKLSGAILAARAILPRTTDPVTSLPRSVILRGERYETPGGWQTLTLANTPKLLRRQVRALRARPGSGPIDDRGAYVSELLLLVPGDPKGVEVQTDELVLEGVLKSAMHGPHLAASDGTRPKRPSEQVTLTADGFRVAGRPFFPRIWTYQGEQLETIRRGGFNVVAFEQPPTEAQLDDAAKHHLLVIGPAGTEGALAWIVAVNQPSDDPTDDSETSAKQLTLDSARAEIQAARKLGGRNQRPLLAFPNGDWGTWSRLVDGLAVGRTFTATPAGQRLQAAWLGSATGLVRPGTPLFFRTQVTHSAEAQNQIDAFVPAGQASPYRDAEQIAGEAWQAIAAGAQGIWIHSSRRLATADAPSARLARRLALLNRQLDLLDPWLAGGSTDRPVLDPNGMPAAAVMKRGQSRLLVPLTIATSQRSQLPITVPGVSETSQAYWLNPCGLQGLSMQRVAGGVRLPSEAFQQGGFVLLADDPAVATAVVRRTANVAKASLDLVQQLTLDDLARWEETRPEPNEQQLSPAIINVRISAERLLSQSNTSEAVGELFRAYQVASEARYGLLEQTRAINQPMTLSANVLSASTQTPLEWKPELAAHRRRLATLVASTRRGGNLLSGGDFESLDNVRRAGWRHAVLEGGKPFARVELSTDRPAHGNKSLQLSVPVASDKQSVRPPPALAAGDCLVWITSPTVSLPAGRLVEISGWVKTEPAAGESPRLIVSDNLGGLELAHIVDAAPDWQPFRLLRRPTTDTDLQLTFGLSGQGTTKIDAVMVRPLDLNAMETAAKDDSKTSIQAK